MRKVTARVRAEAVRLRHEALSLREIAERLGISPNTVRTALAPEVADVEIPGDDAAAAEWAMVELRDAHPDVDAELDRGEPITGALASVLGPYWPTVYRTPANLAALVLEATEFPGEVDDAPTDEGAAELGRAVKLLEGALAIVRKRGIAPRWKQRSPKQRARR